MQNSAIINVVIVSHSFNNIQTHPGSYLQQKSFP